MVDTVNISTGEEVPTAGTTEHLEEMLDVVEASENPEVSDKPEWLPSKFDSPEDLAEAYRQLEQRLGSGEHLEEDDNAVYDDGPVELEEDPTEITEFLASRDLDFDAFQSEYLENGELSDDAYEALANAGIPPSLVDSWLAGQQAVGAQLEMTVHDSVGGTENYNELVNWASDNWSQDEIDAFNDSVDSPNINQVMLAVRGLQAQYNLANGDPALYSGDGGSPSVEGFQSLNQVTEAMKDPRYAEDPAYRRQVEQLLYNSDVI